MLLAVFSVSCVADNPAYGDGSDRASAGGDATQGPNSAGEESGGSASASASGTSSPGTGGAAGTAGESLGSTDGPTGVLLFVDELVTDFAAGEHGQTAFDDGLIIATNSAEGTFRSRLFVADDPVRWVEFGWRPAAPYGLALPDAAAQEDETSRYPEGAADLDGLELLYHFDEPEFTSRTSIADTSGSQAAGTLGFGDPMDVGDVEPTEGVFGSAMRNQAQSAYIDAPLQALGSEAGSFTWSAWYRVNGAYQSATLLSLDSPSDVPQTPAMYLLYAGDGDGLCNQDELAVNVGRQNAESLRECSLGTLDAQRWHHVVMRTTELSNDFRVEVFLDGNPSGSWDAGFPLPDTSVGAADVTSFVAGQGPPSSFGGQGDYDEVAVWDRALSDAEVRALYLRGARFVSVQVRVCSEPGCEDDPPFVGPDGSPSTAFVDRGDGDFFRSLEQAPVGRTLQYEVTLRRASADLRSPLVERVQALAQPLP